LEKVEETKQEKPDVNPNPEQAQTSSEFNINTNKIRSLKNKRFAKKTTTDE